MNVLADLHHGDLYHSFRMLFEKRLGWNLYRPIGLEWWNYSFWKYSENLPTVHQYLSIPANAERKDDHILVPDPNHAEFYKCLTFDQFEKKDIDIVIASVHQHEEPYRRLIKEHKPKAKLIRQAGNIHDIIDPNICKNIMAACCLDDVPEGVNLVVYHEEFDTSIYEYVRPSTHKKIKNFMNCVPDSRDFYLWPRYKSELSEFNWKMYGILGEDGIIGTAKEIAAEMWDSTFIWHVKHGGDGFGHVIHNAFASGRPVITRASHYKDCLAESLLEDCVTCIDLDKRSFDENIAMIRELSQPDKHQKMCKNVIERFNEVVNFDKQFIFLKKFLDNLV